MEKLFSFIFMLIIFFSVSITCFAAAESGRSPVAITPGTPMYEYGRKIILAVFIFLYSTKSILFKNKNDK